MNRQGAQVRLIRWASEQRDAPFKWGETDCVALAFRGISAAFETEYPADRIAWQSEGDARLILRQTPRDGLTELFGFVPVPQTMAQPGDVLVQLPETLNDLICVHLILSAQQALSSTEEHGVRVCDTQALMRTTMGAYRCRS